MEEEGIRYAVRAVRCDGEEDGRGWVDTLTLDKHYRQWHETLLQNVECGKAS